MLVVIKWPCEGCLVLVVTIISISPYGGEYLLVVPCGVDGPISKKGETFFFGIPSWCWLLVGLSVLMVVMVCDSCFF